MEQLTLTMAGQQALAGGARLCTGSRVRTAWPATAAPAALAMQDRLGYHHAAVPSAVIADPIFATSTVFDGKNRPTRQPSELSP